MKAIVLDSNVFGGGNLDLRTLRQWVRDARSVGAEVWIPEPVLWELVAHLWEQVEKANQTLSAVAVALRRAGLPPPQEISYPTPDAMLNTLVELILDLGDGIAIVPCAPEDAVEALMDQILQRPPGRKIKDIRTGAADSAWIRAALRKIDDPKDLVIVSNDADVTMALRSWNASRVRHFATAQEARSAVFHYGLGPLDLTYEVLSFLNSSLLGVTQQTSWVARSLMDASVLLQSVGLEADAHVVSTDITEIDRIVGAQPVRVSSEGSSATIGIDVSATIDVRFGPAHGSLSDVGAGEFTTRNSVLHLPLWIQLEQGEPIAAGLDQTARALEAPAVWNNPQDAFEDCLRAFFRVPEHSGEELRHDGFRNWDVQIHLHGGHEVDLKARFEQSDWKVDATAPWGVLELTCTQLPARGRWLVTVAEDGPIDPGPPSWALSAFLIRRI